MPGHELDLTKRGMEAGLVFDRDLGVMLGGQRAGTGLGYDVGLFNPAGRSGATRYDVSQLGDAAVAVARVARIPRSGTRKRPTERALRPVARERRPTPRRSRISLQRHELERQDRMDGRRRRARQCEPHRANLLCSRRLSVDPKIELVARYYAGRSDLLGAGTRLTNTFFGATLRLFDAPRMNGRLQLNYVLAGGDERGYSGVAGYRDDSILVQFQIYAGP